MGSVAGVVAVGALGVVVVAVQSQEETLEIVPLEVVPNCREAPVSWCWNVLLLPLLLLIHFQVL